MHFSGTGFRGRRCPIPRDTLSLYMGKQTGGESGF
nr:MAG TPA: hypothetical protein [Caudoviricetes sp.]